MLAFKSYIENSKKFSKKVRVDLGTSGFETDTVLTELSSLSCKTEIFKILI